MNNKAHLRPKDFDSNGDIIPMACKEENGDLISREDLREDLRRFFPTEVLEGIEPKTLFAQIMHDIDNAPSVETTKVEHKAYNEGFKDGVDQGIKLSERPQGEWIFHKDYNESCRYGCNQCGNLNNIPHNFCPNCGARMKKETDIYGSN